MPADIDLEGRILILGQRLLVIRQVHQAVVVFQDRGRRGT